MSPRATAPAGEAPAVLRHLACCVDDSGISRQALREVAYLAGVCASRLSVVHVAQTPALSPLRALARGTAGKDRADMLRRVRRASISWGRGLIAGSSPA